MFDHRSIFTVLCTLMVQTHSLLQNCIFFTLSIWATWISSLLRDTLLLRKAAQIFDPSWCDCSTSGKITPNHAINDVTKEIVKLRSKENPSLDLKTLLRNAIENQRLIITLPWIIEYCSMLDSISVQMPYFEEFFRELILVYRHVLIPQKKLVCSPSSKFVWYQ